MFPINVNNTQKKEQYMLTNIQFKKQQILIVVDI